MAVGASSPPLGYLSLHGFLCATTRCRQIEFLLGAGTVVPVEYRKILHGADERTVSTCPPYFRTPYDLYVRVVALGGIALTGTILPVFHPGCHVTILAGTTPTAPVGVQIGRASCRERA